MRSTDNGDAGGGEEEVASEKPPLTPSPSAITILGVGDMMAGGVG